MLKLLFRKELSAAELAAVKAEELLPNAAGNDTGAGKRTPARYFSPPVCKKRIKKYEKPHRYGNAKAQILALISNTTFTIVQKPRLCNFFIWGYGNEEVQLTEYGKRIKRRLLGDYNNKIRRGGLKIPI